MLYDGDDIFITMMFEYYMNELLEEDVSPLLIRSAVLSKNHEEEHEHLYYDYFVDNCLYLLKGFKQKFCLNRSLLVQIANTL